MPALPDGVRRAFRLAVRRPAIERDVDAEIAFHLEMRAAELEARGLTHDAARAEARRRFGDPRRWSEAMTAEDHDRTTTERKGPSRPILPQEERAELLAGLACVW